MSSSSTSNPAPPQSPQAPKPPPPNPTTTKPSSSSSSSSSSATSTTTNRPPNSILTHLDLSTTSLSQYNELTGEYDEINSDDLSDDEDEDDDSEDDDEEEDDSSSSEDEETLRNTYHARRIGVNIPKKSSLRNTANADADQQTSSTSTSSSSTTTATTASTTLPTDDKKKNKRKKHKNPTILLHGVQIPLKPSHHHNNGSFSHNSFGDDDDLSHLLLSEGLLSGGSFAFQSEDDLNDSMSRSGRDRGHTFGSIDLGGRKRINSLAMTSDGDVSVDKERKGKADLDSSDTTMRRERYNSLSLPSASLASSSSSRLPTGLSNNSTSTSTATSTAASTSTSASHPYNRKRGYSSIGNIDDLMYYQIQEGEERDAKDSNNSSDRNKGLMKPPLSKNIMKRNSSMKQDTSSSSSSSLPRSNSNTNLDSQSQSHHQQSSSSSSSSGAQTSAGPHRTRIFSIDLDPDMDIDDIEILGSINTDGVDDNWGVGNTSLESSKSNNSSSSNLNNLRRSRGDSIDLNLGRRSRTNSMGGSNEDLALNNRRGGRTRGMSFEFFNFQNSGMDAGAPDMDLENLNSINAASNNGVKTRARPRGDSIIFEAGSFKEGGIHVRRALENTPTTGGKKQKGKKGTTGGGFDVSNGSSGFDNYLSEGDDDDDDDEDESSDSDDSEMSDSSGNYISKHNISIHSDFDLNHSPSTRVKVGNMIQKASEMVDTRMIETKASVFYAPSANMYDNLKKNSRQAKSNALTSMARAKAKDEKPNEKVGSVNANSVDGGRPLSKKARAKANKLARELAAMQALESESIDDDSLASSSSASDPVTASIPMGIMPLPAQKTVKKSKKQLREDKLEREQLQLMNMGNGVVDLNAPLNYKKSHKKQNRQHARAASVAAAEYITEAMNDEGSDDEFDQYIQPQVRKSSSTSLPRNTPTTYATKSGETVRDIEIRKQQEELENGFDNDGEIDPKYAKSLKKSHHKKGSASNPYPSDYKKKVALFNQASKAVPKVKVNLEEVETERVKQEELLLSVRISKEEEEVKRKERARIARAHDVLKKQEERQLKKEEGEHRRKAEAERRRRKRKRRKDDEVGTTSEEEEEEELVVAEEEEDDNDDEDEDFMQDLKAKRVMSSQSAKRVGSSSKAGKGKKAKPRYTTSSYSYSSSQSLPLHNPGSDDGASNSCSDAISIIGAINLKNRPSEHRDLLSHVDLGRLGILNLDGRIGIYNKTQRTQRLRRFHSNRRSRVWRKKINYDCRKKLADTRPRIKGRFITKKDGDEPGSVGSEGDIAGGQAERGRPPGNVEVIEIDDDDNEGAMTRGVVAGGGGLGISEGEVEVETESDVEAEVGAEAGTEAEEAVGGGVEEGASASVEFENDDAIASRDSQSQGESEERTEKPRSDEATASI